MSTPAPDPLFSLVAAIRAYAEATALPAPAIYGLRQFFIQITPSPLQTQHARVFYPHLLDHDDPLNRDNAARGTGEPSRPNHDQSTRDQATQTEAAQDPLGPNNSDLGNLWRCCPSPPIHACYSRTRGDPVSRWRFHCTRHYPHSCPCRFHMPG